MLLAFLPVYLKQLAFPDATIGLVTGAYSISALLLMIPLGILADRISPRKILLVGGVVVWVHILGLLAAHKAWHFLVLAGLGGLGWAVFQIVLYALYLKVISERYQGMKIAIFQAGQFLGYGVGPLFAGMLWDHMDYQRMLGFAIGGGIFLNLCIFGLLDTEPISFDWKGYREDLSKGRTLLFLGICFLFATHFGVEQTAYTLFMRHELQFTNRQIGLSYFSVGIWMAFLSPFVGHRFDVKQNLLQLLGFGLALSAIFQVWTAWVHSLPGMVIVRILHTLGDAPAILAMGIMTALFFPKGRMGGNSAAIYMARTLGSFAGSLLTGALAPVVGYGGSFVYNGLFVLAASLCLYPLMQRQLALIPRADGAPAARAAPSPS